jgi:hypothetical protein
METSTLTLFRISPPEIRPSRRLPRQPLIFDGRGERRPRLRGLSFLGEGRREQQPPKAALP